MKGFTNSTKTIAGHNFTKVATFVKSHTRQMPTQKVTKPVPAPFAEGGKVDRDGFGPNATGDENNNGRSFRQGQRKGDSIPRSKSQLDPDAGMFEAGSAAAAMRKPRKGVEKYDFSENTKLTPAELDSRTQMQAMNMRRQSDGFKRGGPVRDPRTPLITPKSGC